MLTVAILGHAEGQLCPGEKCLVILTEFDGTRGEGEFGGTVPYTYSGFDVDIVYDGYFTATR